MLRKREDSDRDDRGDRGDAASVAVGGGRFDRGDRPTAARRPRSPTARHQREKL